MATLHLKPKEPMDIDVSTGEAQMEALRDGATPQELADALHSRKERVDQGGFGKIPKGMEQEIDWGDDTDSGMSAGVGSS